MSLSLIFLRYIHLFFYGNNILVAITHSQMNNFGNNFVVILFLKGKYYHGNNQNEVLKINIFEPFLLQVKFAININIHPLG